MPSEPTPPYVVVETSEGGRGKRARHSVQTDLQIVGYGLSRAHAFQLRDNLHTAWLAGYAAGKAEQERTTE